MTSIVSSHRLVVEREEDIIDENDIGCHCGQSWAALYKLNGQYASVDASMFLVSSYRIES